MRAIGLLAAILGLSCAPEHRPAQEYCERTAEMFCAYYLRCGRMAEDTPEACEATFLETCNAVYEPRYAALEAEGLLALSTEGLRACEDHLETVACEAQVFDLDGGCAQMWEGLALAGDPCGLGIESFVCDAESTCVIGLDLCGTCESAVGVDEACGDGLRCKPPGVCVASTCVPAALPGEPCGDLQPCVLGATCVEGTCEAPEIVGIGDSCDLDHRCPYKSACLGGECVEAALLGESCAATTCASGWCDGATCQPLKAAGDPCDGAIECLSLSCDTVCGDLLRQCFDP